MTNPLDYTIQDADAMRYALMQDSSYRKGGAVRMADGGILDGHPVFQTAQVPFAEYRHSIGMNHGGAHMEEGGVLKQLPQTVDEALALLVIAIKNELSKAK